MDIHVHIHNDEVKEGRKPRKSSARQKNSPGKPKRKGKPMTRKQQLAINRGRKEAGLKPIKWKKKGK